MLFGAGTSGLDGWNRSLRLLWLLLPAFDEVWVLTEEALWQRERVVGDRVWLVGVHGVGDDGGWDADSGGGDGWPAQGEDGAGRGEGGRWWRGGVLLVNRQPHVLSDFALSLPSPVVAPLEVLQACRVNGPIVAFPVGRPPGLDEAVVEAEIVPDGVAPSRAPVPEVGVVVQDVLVDVCQHQLHLLAAKNGH